MHSRRSLGDLISAGAGAAAAVQAGASGSGGTSAATAASTAAAARLTSVRDSEAATQRNAARGTAAATAITDAISSVAAGVGGPAGQWLAFLLGGTAAPPSETIASNDLKTLKDVLVIAVPTTVIALNLAKVGLAAASSTDATALAVLNYFIGYLPRVQAAAVAACTAAGPNCGVGATPPPAAAPPPPDVETPYVPPPAAAAQTSSEATYLLPVGAIALAAILFFLKR